VSVLANSCGYPLNPEENGYFHAFLPGLKEGETYAFFVDGEGPFPDPASRFQPQGPHGPSQVVNPKRFAWTDQGWNGISIKGQVIYEMHVGTFTAQGTWQAATRELSALRALGITTIEVMPIAEFSGAFGWGYDGVNLFSPTRNYGTPDDFRAFVNQAHAHGIAVILDVVYNHLGPDGNYLSKFSKNYFSDNRKTEWGPAINFSGNSSNAVREFYIANSAYWISEFHLDGLRLDATQDIHDSSDRHILNQISCSARKAAGPRRILLIGENEPQNTRLIRPSSQGGYALDALWNDDFHHSAVVAATGRREAYYTDYFGSAQELLSAIKYGFLFQGQFYSWQKARRGTPALDLNPSCMIAFLQNHDQIANSAYGKRLHELTTFGRYKALTAVMLLAPSTPMLFQGQEFSASSPFLYFADQKPEIAKIVREGRRKFLDQWRSLASVRIEYDEPSSAETFQKCKLDLTERDSKSQVYRLHRDLLWLRKRDPLIARQDRQLDGAILNDEAFVLRFFSENHSQDLLLTINLGSDLVFNPSPEPLLAPPSDTHWVASWSSEALRYGGQGIGPLDSEQGWILPGHSAVLLRPRPIRNAISGSRR